MLGMANMQITAQESRAQEAGGGHCFGDVAGPDERGSRPLICFRIWVPQIGFLNGMHATHSACTWDLCVNPGKHFLLQNTDQIRQESCELSQHPASHSLGQEPSSFLPGLNSWLALVFTYSVFPVSAAHLIRDPRSRWMFYSVCSLYLTV